MKLAKLKHVFIHLGANLKLQMRRNTLVTMTIKLKLKCYNKNTFRHSIKCFPWTLQQLVNITL